MRSKDERPNSANASLRIGVQRARLKLLLGQVLYLFLKYRIRKVGSGFLRSCVLIH
ncbi:hypothetical protein LEP1GSC040_3882 [Leptospira santarosai str. 2000030832]|nr:hypothetical protein LEP1GSC040_3882 [Leptospira santarosai str. 2000030832]